MIVMDWPEAPVSVTALVSGLSAVILACRVSASGSGTGLTMGLFCGAIPSCAIADGPSGSSKAAATKAIAVGMVGSLQVIG